ncbi:hypothetical protein GN956_G19542 [Arapaima gigas]
MPETRRGNCEKFPPLTGIRREKSVVFLPGMTGLCAWNRSLCDTFSNAGITLDFIVFFPPPPSSSCACASDE